MSEEKKEENKAEPKEEAKAETKAEAQVESKEEIKAESKVETSASPKKILEELDKSAAASVGVQPQASPVKDPQEKTPPVEISESQAVSKTTEPVEAALVEIKVPADAPINPSPSPAETSVPLISDAMRRLDDLLARFRGLS